MDTQPETTGTGGRIPSWVRSDAALQERALVSAAERKVLVPDEVVQEAIETARALLSHHDGRCRSAGARLIFAAKLINVKIDSNDAKRNAGPSVVHVHQHIDKYAAVFGPGTTITQVQVAEPGSAADALEAKPEAAAPGETDVQK